MALDLIIRGTGSKQGPGAHLSVTKPLYDRADIMLYGDLEGDGVAGSVLPADPDALAAAIRRAGGTQLLIYGDESLLPLAQDLEPGLIWIALAAHTNVVREVWRLRQQHNWLTGRKLSLLVEETEGVPLPDTEQIIRLSRADRVLVVPAVAEAPGISGRSRQQPMAGGKARRGPRALVSKRRAIAVRLAQAEVTIGLLLREVFAARFASGPDQAAAFEQLARQLAAASTRLTQLSRSMAAIEEQLSQLKYDGTSEPGCTQ